MEERGFFVNQIGCQKKLFCHSDQRLSLIHISRTIFRKITAAAAASTLLLSGSSTALAASYQEAEKAALSQFIKGFSSYWDVVMEDQEKAMAGTKAIMTLKLEDGGKTLLSCLLYTSKSVKKAVVIGAGFIGLEAAENLKAKGVQVTVIDFASQILPNIIDPEMAVYAKKHLLREGIRVITGTKAEAVLGNEAVTGVKTSAGVLGCELLIMAAGIRPNTDFLVGSGLEMFKGTILVDHTMKTNLEDVYAAGDCVMVTNRLTGKNPVSYTHLDVYKRQMQNI